MSTMRKTWFAAGAALLTAANVFAAGQYIWTWSVVQGLTPVGVPGEASSSVGVQEFYTKSSSAAVKYRFSAGKHGLNLAIGQTADIEISGVLNPSDGLKVYIAPNSAYGSVEPKPSVLIDKALFEQTIKSGIKFTISAASYGSTGQRKYTVTGMGGHKRLGVDYFLSSDTTVFIVVTPMTHGTGASGTWTNSYTIRSYVHETGSVPGGGDAVVSLSGISITGGASSVDSGGSTTFGCNAQMSDSSVRQVSASWSITSGGSYATINQSTGEFRANSTTVSRSVTVQASYTYNGVTKTATKSVTINPAVARLTSFSIWGQLTATPGETFKLNSSSGYSLAPSGDATVAWSILSGSSYARVDSKGNVTIYSGKYYEDTTVTIKAVCTYNGVSLGDTHAVTIKANAVKTYAVAYKPGAHGSGSQQSDTKTHGVALTLKGAVFSRTGYVQTGWSTSDGGSKAYGLGASYTANAALTLYPFWEKVEEKEEPAQPVYCRVSFNANGGKGGSQRTVASGMAVGTLPKATRKGHKFRGWYTKKSGGTKIKATTKVTRNATYYARWTANKYTIKFNANGGRGKMKAQSATYGKIIRLRANAFTKSGCKFAGWALKKNGMVVCRDKTRVRNLTDKNGKTVTLYAKWRKVKP